jgi:hypothetical protein
MPLANSAIRASVVAILIAMTAALFVVRGSTAAPVVTTDKADYYSGETVTVTGVGFAPSTTYDVPIIRPDGSIVHGDGSFTPGWDSVTSDGSGAFTYLYQLNGIFGTYEVRVYNSPWSGNLTDSPLATVTFTDADIHFSQCQNDGNNDDIANACSWTTGGLNQNNSLYTEGDAPPQRLFHRLDEIGTHTFGFEYEFSKSDIYAYDFITNVDDTQGGALLAECADLPGFISAAQCTAMFSTNVQFGSVPSDLFDQVTARENPPGAAARSFRVGCTPACAVGVTVEFPDPPTGPTDGEDNPGGEAHTPDSDPDCFKNCGDSDVIITVSVTTASASTRVGMWFAGHLAETADPIGSAIGWGTGCNGGGACGSSSIAGAPFHVKYTCLREPSDTSCDSVGNRDNQIQTGGVLAPGTVTITKVAVPEDPQDFSFTGDLGAFLLDDDGANGNPLDDSIMFTSLTPGSYAVTETVPDGWDLTGLSCIDPDGGTSTTPPTATIDVDSGEDITCTFTNTLNSDTFNVAKDFSDNSSTAVNVSLSCTSGSVTTNDATATEVPADTADFTVNGFSGDPTCTATETPIPAGYSSSGTCSALLSVGTCTIVNSLNSDTFTVAKDFSDDSSAAVNVSLSCTSGSVTTNDATATEVPPDTADFTVNGFSGDPTCTATETPIPAGYSSSGTCSALLSVGTCTIVNNLIPPETGTIIVCKETTPDASPQSFTFSTSYSPNFNLSDGQCDNSGPLTTGTYSVSETIPGGWTLTSATCDNSSPINAIDLGPSETITCTFNNTLNSDTFTVAKDFSDNSSAAVNVSLSCTSGSVTTNDATATEVPADTADFTVNGFSGDPTCTATETPIPAGYSSSGTCSALLSVGTCTITNTLNPPETGTIIVEVAVDGAPLSFSIAEGTNYVLGIPLQLQSFSFTGDAAGVISPGQQIIVSGLAPSSYTSTETVPAGWSLISIVCDDTDSTGDTGTATATFNLEGGETVTCVFTNAQQGSTPTPGGTPNPVGGIAGLLDAPNGGASTSGAGGTSDAIGSLAIVAAVVALAVATAWAVRKAWTRGA